MYLRSAACIQCAVRAGFRGARGARRTLRRRRLWQPLRRAEWAIGSVEVDGCRLQARVQVASQGRGDTEQSGGRAWPSTILGWGSIILAALPWPALAAMMAAPRGAGPQLTLTRARRAHRPWQWMASVARVSAVRCLAWPGRHWHSFIPGRIAALLTRPGRVGEQPPACLPCLAGQTDTVNSLPTP